MSKRKERVIDAEVVRTSGEPAKQVDARREQHTGPMRIRSRAWFRQEGNLALPDEALRRARWRFGVGALLALGVTAALIWFAATTEYVLLAALFILAALVTGLVGMVFGAMWRLIGRFSKATQG